MNSKELDKLCKKLRAGGVMSDEERLAFVSWGLHRLFCTPVAPIREGPKAGRIEWHEDLMAEFGSEDCECWDRQIIVNGQVLRAGR